MSVESSILGYILSIFKSWPENANFTRPYYSVTLCARKLKFALLVSLGASYHPAKGFGGAPKTRPVAKDLISKYILH